MVATAVSMSEVMASAADDSCPAVSARAATSAVPSASGVVPASAAACSAFGTCTTRASMT